MGNKRYYERHLRSLFISKFSYKYPKDIVKPFGGNVELRSKTKFLDMFLLFLFLTSGRGSYGFKFLVKNGWIGGQSPIGYEDFFQTVLSIVITCLPRLDNAKSTNLPLRARTTDGSFIVDLSGALTTFRDLDYLVGFRMKSLKSISRSWKFHFGIKTNTGSTIEGFTLLRSLSLPSDTVHSG